MNTNTIAPKRKGFSDGKKSKRPGTGQYWCRHIRNNIIIKTHPQFQALTEFEAGGLALQFCGFHYIDNNKAPWKFVHECNTHRGYELKLENDTIQLFHVMEK